MTRKVIGQGLWGIIRGAINENFTALFDSSHNHDNKDVLDATEEPFTTKERNKLASVNNRFRGLYDDAEAAALDNPSPEIGWWFINAETHTLWGVYDFNDGWVDTGVLSAGDMLSSMYDPYEVGKEVYLRNNHRGFQEISTITGLRDELDTLDGKGNFVMGTPSVFPAEGASINTAIIDLPGLEDKIELQWDVSGGGGEANLEIVKKGGVDTYNCFSRWHQIANSFESTNGNPFTPSSSSSARIIKDNGDILRISHHLRLSSPVACETVELTIVPEGASKTTIYKYDIFAVRKDTPSSAMVYIRRTF